MQTSLAFPKKVAAVVLSLFALLVCLSLSAWAQQKKPGPRYVVPPLQVSPLQPVGPDCTTVTTGNLITNCGFETGDFTGWVVLDAGNMSVDRFAGNHGLFAAVFGSQFRAGCIGQTNLATNPGQTYILSFALTNSSSPNNFYVLFNGATVSGDMQNMPDFHQYTQYLIGASIGGLVAVGADTVFFCARNDSGFFDLDDVIFIHFP
jgi:hypothetical protein